MVHDAITGRSGSHRATLANLRRLIALGIPIRVGIITMAQNGDTIEETKRFLNNEGVLEVGVDRTRRVGRGISLSTPSLRQDEMAELCGRCWDGSLCVSANGTVYPCIMSRRWPVGSVRDSTLGEIVKSAALGKFREQMRASQVAVSNDSPACDPWGCDPRCPPHCSPACTPQHGCQPDQCWPKYD